MHIYKRNTKSQSSNQPFQNNNNKPYKNCRRKYRTDNNETENKHGDFPDGPGLRLHPFNAGGLGSSPDWGIKIPHAMRYGPKFVFKKGNREILDNESKTDSLKGLIKLINSWQDWSGEKK